MGLMKKLSIGIMNKSNCKDCIHGGHKENDLDYCYKCCFSENQFEKKENEN